MKRAPLFAWNQPPKYVGVLRKPILVEDGPILEAGAKFTKTFCEKLAPLFKLYEIEPPKSADDGSWSTLAIMLAFAHVPGFKVEAKGLRRRRSQHDLTEEVALIVDVAKMMEKHQCGISEAVNNLVNSPKFPRWHQKNKRSLENRYHLAVRAKRVRDFLASL